VTDVSPKILQDPQTNPRRRREASRVDMSDQEAPEPSVPASEIEDDEAGSDTEQASTAQIKRCKGYQVDRAETGGPAAASAVLQPLPAFVAAAAAVLQLLSAVLQPLPAFAASASANLAVPLPILKPLPAAASAVPVVTRDIGESSKSPESGGVGLSISPLLLKQMEDEAEEKAVPLRHEQYTENSPSGKVHQRAPRPPAAVWKTVKRLRDVTLMGKRFSDHDGRAVCQFTHVCVRCWKLLYYFRTLSVRDKWGGWGGSRRWAGDGAVDAKEGGARMEGSAGMEEETCGDTESENEEEPSQAAEEPVLSQSAIDAAFDAQLTIDLTVEFEKALKNYRQVHSPQISQHSHTKFSIFCTVIVVADNGKDDVEIDCDYIYTCINIYMIYYIYMTYVYMYTYTYTEEFATLHHNSQGAIISHFQC